MSNTVRLYVFFGFLLWWGAVPGPAGQYLHAQTPDSLPQTPRQNTTSPPTNNHPSADSAAAPTGPDSLNWRVDTLPQPTANDTDTTHRKKWLYKLWRPTTSPAESHERHQRRSRHNEASNIHDPSGHNQVTNVHDRPALCTLPNCDTPRVTNLKEFFTKGIMGGHLRNHFMATVHPNRLKDPYANATGGALKYQTAELWGLRLGVSGLFTFNTFSSNLAEPSSLANRPPRWERQLFDLTRPAETTDLDRLEELFILYRWRSSWVKVGRQQIVSPLMNPQDTRMKPYVFRGVWMNINELKHLAIKLGFFDRISPRSTTEFFGAGESIGLYGVGVDLEGNPSQYPHHVETKGVLVAGLGWKPLKTLEVQGWNYWIENVSNTLWLQADLHQPAFRKVDVVGGLQVVQQTPLGQGGNALDSLRYQSLEQQGNLLSLRAGLAEPHRWSVTANYTRLFASGRLQFPREWGREQYYTTVGRGRVEGLGDAHQWMIMLNWHPDLHRNLSLTVAAGQTYTNPTPALNKYGVVDYNQINVDISYHFHQLLEGLHLRFLYVYKANMDGVDQLQDAWYTHNFHHFNLVTNIDF